jgi:hypothetical protein
MNTDSILSHLRTRKPKNVVVRELRDRDGHILDYLTHPHNGSPRSIISAAKTVTDRMYALYFNASNGESRICATDACGNPRWVVAPNLLPREHRVDVNLRAYGPSPMDPRRTDRCLQSLLQGTIRKNSQRESTAYRAGTIDWPLAIRPLVEVG